MSDHRDVSEAIRFAEEHGYREWSAAQDALNRLVKAARAARRLANRINEDEHRSATGRRLTSVARVYDVTPQFLRGVQDDVEEVNW